jgi:hypothetical protein
MNVSLSLPNIYSFKQFLPSLTLHTKILGVAVLALTSLAACYYMIKHYCYQNTRHGEKVWWSKINHSENIKKFKKNWKSFADNKTCNKEAARLRSIYYDELDFRLIDEKIHKHHALAGQILGVPAYFSLWMAGVALIAAYLAEKKHVEGLFVCESLEAFSTRLKEIALNPSNQRCVLIIPTVQPGLRLDPNFPQHKVAVCIEKKEGKLTIALLESEPLPGVNKDIDPTHLTDNIWEKLDDPYGFNNQELAFRAILKACRHAKIQARLFHSEAERQKTYGCEVFAIQDALSFLEDPDFFSRIVCSDKKIKVDEEFQIERIIRLPPENMRGVQSFKLFEDYKAQVGQAM